MDSLSFEHFEVIRREDDAPWELGRGAMGVTYKAWDTRLHCPVALKVITPALLDAPGARERFQREARAAAHLHHPNVAGVFYLGVVKKSVFYAMEFVEGETLAALLKRHRKALPVGLALNIAAQAAEGLAAAHQRGMIHRDIKPANLMVAPLPHATGHATAVHVKIIDFGLAKPLLPSLCDGTNADASLTGAAIMGTPHFMSPEQIDRVNYPHAIDVRADIYSLGATLWTLLAGGPPFQGTALQVLHAQAHQTPPFERLTDLQLPAGVVDLLRRMLAKDPAQRPANCLNLISELRLLCREAETLASDPDAAETIALLAPASTQRMAEAAPPPRAVPSSRFLRRKSRLLVAGIGSLLGLAALIWLLRGFPEAPRQPLAVGAATGGVTPPRVVDERAPATKSIAVLPFDNLSGGEQNTFLADGVQEDVLTNLAKVADLKVISRTSVMGYRTGANRPSLRDIARVLGVAHLVEGTVRREGNRVRVVARLIDARNDDALLWSESYDQELASVFDLQSQIAHAIADQLQARLSPQERRALSEPPTRDVAANALYQSSTELMQAGFGSDKQDPEEGWKKAIVQLEAALSLDPNFVQAYSRLAEAHALLYFYSYDTSDARREAIRQAAATALRLRPNAGEAHRAMGIYHYYGPRDFSQAREELLQALRTLPNDSKTLLYLGLIERRQGRWEAGLDFFRKAAELDPREPDTLNKCADTLVGLGRFAEADATLDKALAIAPQQSWYRKSKAYVALWGRADLKAARAELAKIPAEYDAEGSVTALRIYLSLCERDAAGAARELAKSRDAEFSPGVLGQRWPREWYEGQIARVQGDAARALAAFAKARRIVAAQVQARRGDPRPLSILGLIDADLGHREEALREGREAVALRPPQQDAYSGPPTALQLAMIYTWTGETDLAIAQLQALAAKPNGPTYGDLRLNPDWDALRDDRRFKALVNALAPPASSNP